MSYIHAEMGEISPGSDKSARIYYDQDGNKMMKTEGSRSWRNNNPGNLAYYKFAKENGAIGSDGRFAIFPDYETGQRARKKLLRGSQYHHLTINEMAYKYEPESPEKSESYCKCIMSRSNLESTRKLDSLNDTEFDKLLQAMQACEGWEVGQETYFPITKITEVCRGQDRTIQYFLIDGTEWVSKESAIQMAENANLSAVVVHMKNGSKYLRPKPSQPAFHALIKQQKACTAPPTNALST